MKNTSRQAWKYIMEGIYSIYEGMKSLRIYPLIQDPEEEIKQIKKELEEISKKSNEALRTDFRNIGNDLRKVMGKPRKNPDFMRQGCEKVGNAMKKSMN